MFSEGYIRATDGHLYYWGVRHYKKATPYCIHGGRVEWVAVADETGAIVRKDTWNYWPENETIRDLVMALIDRFDKEGE